MYLRKPSEEDNLAAGVGVITSDVEMFPEDNVFYRFFGHLLEAGGITLAVDGENPVNFSDSDKKDLLIFSSGVDELLRSPVWPGFDAGGREDVFGGYMLVRKSQLFEGESGFRYFFMTAFQDHANILREMECDSEPEKGVQAIMYRGESHNGVEFFPTLARTSAKPFLGSTYGQVAGEPIWIRPDGSSYRLNTVLKLEAYEEFARGIEAFLAGKSPQEAGIHPEIADSQRQQFTFSHYAKYLNHLYPDGSVNRDKHLQSEADHKEHEMVVKNTLETSINDYSM
jgi:hypothetical protein